MKAFFVLLLSSVVALAAPTTSGTSWTGSWAASPVAEVGSTATSLADAEGSTYRDVVHLSLGGNALRLRITNEFGGSPLIVGGVHVALSAGKDAIEPGTDHGVTFGGSESVTIPAGAMIVSDPVAMPVAALANLTVSIFVPAQTMPVLTYHALATSTNYITAGNTMTANKLDTAKKVDVWYLLKGVDVDAGAHATDIVTFGDSITDGARSTTDRNARWPDVLAARLHANKRTEHIGVLNEGISGNRLLHDNFGPDALARLDRDVLSQGAAKYLIVMLGINDIGHTSQPRVPIDRVTSEQIFWALQQIAFRAHARGMKVYVATLTPYERASYQDVAGSKMRNVVNAMIRSSDAFDAVIDFDKLMRDPAHPESILPAYDSNDHLHPGDAGYKAMGESIDLNLFQ